ncbi:ABC transporter substrate-binding protein [Mangrovicoccus algicola]|uniref:ABC transporter substrate-binding protein n=1 Tax=Mangrovicoccus algicola TaxID=2771008 RepID=A0A8J6YWW6_9RHOB|nr:ABC transporter substrate-binding protein [Mangrovicoccus algicola]MBE3637296.1 ABC transporter substrate-binding protein [Mangrovicoccus algicola]
MILSRRGPGRLLCLSALTGLILPMAALRADPAGFPLEIANCGHPLQVAAPPARAVSLGQGTTEILLSLGVTDRIAGTAIWLDPLPAPLAEAGAALPRLADNSPGFETVLAVRPDFVAAQWINDIGPGESRVGSWDQFADFGIPAYVSPAECAKSAFNAGSGDGARSQAWDMALLEQEIAELAAIFDRPEAGAALIAANRARIEAVTAGAEALRGRDVSVLYWFSSPRIEGEAYVAGRLGAPGWISQVTGLRNVIDSQEEWPLVGWETIAALDPDVIVLGRMERRSLPGDDVAAKRAFLERDPVASRLSAVREGRLIEMPAQSMNPTLRAVDGVEVLAAGLRDLGLAP